MCLQSSANSLARRALIRYVAGANTPDEGRAGYRTRDLLPATSVNEKNAAQRSPFPHVSEDPAIRHTMPQNRCREQRQRCCAHTVRRTFKRRRLPCRRRVPPANAAAPGGATTNHADLRHAAAPRSGFSAPADGVICATQIRATDACGAPTPHGRRVLLNIAAATPIIYEHALHARRRRLARALHARAGQAAKPRARHRRSRASRIIRLPLPHEFLLLPPALQRWQAARFQPAAARRLKPVRCSPGGRIVTAAPPRFRMFCFSNQQPPARCAQRTQRRHTV